VSARTARAPQRKAGKSRASGRGRGRARPGGFGEAVRRVSGWIFLALLAALVLAVIAELRIPQLIGTKAGETIGKAGFSLRHVEIKGARHITKLDVYNIAFDQPSAAMPLVDLEATRQRLLRFGWVRDARVLRRLPDTLVIDIVERRPAAIWQHNQQLALIDMDGTVLAPVRLDAMPNLPLIIGPAANLHAAELGRLVEAAPQLKPVMAGANWVGERRWDLRFQSGEVLALPEGEDAARRALAKFAEIDQATQLLGRGIVRFDMRIPGKLIARVSSEPGGGIAPPAPPPPADAAPAARPAPAGRKPTGAAAVDRSKTI
jgi:cell division protein FtsQ